MPDDKQPAMSELDIPLRAMRDPDFRLSMSHRYVWANEIEEMLARIAELEAIVEKLPTYRNGTRWDGVTMPWVWDDRHGYPVQSNEARLNHHGEWWCRFYRVNGPDIQRQIKLTHPTEQAAREAAGMDEIGL